jgi:NADH-quinone oxidoreductase subunit K
MVPTLYLYYVLLAALLFVLGVIGVLIRRNALVVFMSVELMLNAANLALVAFAQARQDAGGQVLVFFVITVAAAEVAVGLALLVTIFRTRRTTNIDDVRTLRD